MAGLSVPIPTLDQLAAQMSVFKSVRSATKLPPAEHICRLLEVGCAADDETAIRRTAPFLMEKYRSYVSWGLEGLTLDPNAAPEQQFRTLASKRFAVGAPASVIDMLVAQHRCGINHLSMRVSWPGMGQDEILAGIELLAARFFPRCGTEPRPRSASAAIEGRSRSGVAQVRRPSEIGQWERLVGGVIIAPLRSNSAHFHRPWRPTSGSAHHVEAAIRLLGLRLALFGSGDGARRCRFMGEHRKPLHPSPSVT